MRAAGDAVASMDGRTPDPTSSVDRFRHKERHSRGTALLTVGGAASVVAALLLLATGTSPSDVGRVPLSTGSPSISTSPLRPAPAAGTVPVELTIRGVRVPVLTVGTDAAGGLALPDRPSTVGWWSPSALAGGATGPTVLAGHVDSASAGIGAFAVLRQVGVGEPIEVRGTGGRTVRYAVTARREYRKAELPPALFATGGPPGLVLITCGGRFDRATGHYESNVVVYAAPA